MRGWDARRGVGGWGGAVVVLLGKEMEIYSLTFFRLISALISGVTQAGDKTTWDAPLASPRSRERQGEKRARGGNGRAGSFNRKEYRTATSDAKQQASPTFV